MFVRIYINIRKCIGAPQTPLSHTNVRAKQNKIPNAYLLHPLSQFTKLIDSPVRLTVNDTGSWEINYFLLHSSSLYCRFRRRVYRACVGEGVGWHDQLAKHANCLVCNEISTTCRTHCSHGFKRCIFHVLVSFRLIWMLKHHWRWIKHRISMLFQLVPKQVLLNWFIDWMIEWFLYFKK